MSFGVASQTPTPGTMILRGQALVFTVTDCLSLSDLLIEAVFADGSRERVYRAGAFGPQYDGTVANDGIDRQFNVTRKGGWPRTFTLQCSLLQLAASLVVTLDVISITSDFEVIPGVFDWIGTVSGALTEWDASDKANGTLTFPWNGRDPAPPLTITNGAGGGGTPTVDAGINGHSRVLYAPFQYSTGPAAASFKGTGDFYVGVVADLQTVGASNTGSYQDSGIIADNNYRWGLSYRNDSGTYKINAYLYDGVGPGWQTVSLALPSLTGPRAYYLRKAGTSLYVGYNNTESPTPATVGALADEGNVRLGAGPDGTSTQALRGYVYKIYSKGNGTAEPAAQSAYATRFS